MLLKHNNSKNSNIANIAVNNIPKNRSFEDCIIQENTDPNIADIPDASKTNANKYSVGIEMLIITNDEIVNMAINENKPATNAVMNFFKTLLSFFIFFVIVSE